MYLISRSVHPCTVLYSLRSFTFQAFWLKFYMQNYKVIKDILNAFFFRVTVQRGNTHTRDSAYCTTTYFGFSSELTLNVSAFFVQFPSRKKETLVIFRRHCGQFYSSVGLPAVSIMLKETYNRKKFLYCSLIELPSWSRYRCAFVTLSIQLFSINIDCIPDMDSLSRCILTVDLN